MLFVCMGIASNLNHLAYPINIDSIPVPPLPLSTLEPFNHKLFLYMQNLLSNQCSTKILGSKSVLCAARGLSSFALYRNFKRYVSLWPHLEDWKLKASTLKYMVRATKKERPYYYSYYTSAYFKQYLFEYRSSVKL